MSGESERAACHGMRELVLPGNLDAGDVPTCNEGFEAIRAIAPASPKSRLEPCEERHKSGPWVG